jgi:hypothetical protein
MQSRQVDKKGVARFARRALALRTEPRLARLGPSGFDP